jgi:hypothetical protein
VTVTFWPTMSAALANANQVARAPLAPDPNTHLLSRLTFGPTPQDRAKLATLGPDAWFQQQAQYGAQYNGYRGDAGVYQRTAMLRMTPYDLDQYLTVRNKKYGWDAMDRLTEVTCGLQTLSVAQLYEVLVDVFANHLNVPNHYGDVWNTRPDYDRTVIRRYAMGSFSDMLVASSKHPAMLTYLSLCQSTKNTLNENYAREVLEVHTVGLHYSESDVTGVARMLTGRTVDDYSHYVYDAYIHATGAVNVLGFSDPNTKAAHGEIAGDNLLKYLARHQFTAQNLARKLCVRFVSDNPSSELVSAVAQAYLDNDTHIVPTIYKIFCSTEFWDSRGLKQRRPAENLIAAIRAVGNTVDNWNTALRTLHWMCNAMNDTPLDWQAPNGYPDAATSWRSSSALLQLWDCHLGFVGSWADGWTDGDITGLYGGTTPTTVGQAIDLLTVRLTGSTFLPEHRQALLTFLGDASFDTPLAQSGMRWRATYLVGLILHSSYHALR